MSCRIAEAWAKVQNTPPAGRPGAADRLLDAAKETSTKKSWDLAHAWLETAWVRWALAVGSGLLTVMAFPRWQWGLLAFVSVAPLLLVLRGASPRQGFAFGLAWGLAFFLVSLSWVTYTMVTYGKMLLPLSLLAWVSLAAILAGYPALFGWAAAHLGSMGPLGWALGVSVLWVTAEFLRARLFTGFPWILLGYSQGSFLDLIQIARFTGVYGVSFLLLLVNAGLVAALTPGFSPWRRLAPGALAALLVLGPVAYGRSVLGGSPRPDTVRVGVVQGNIDQALKWDPAMQETTLAKYRRLTLDLARERPALVIWPEAAMPFFLRTDQRLGPQVLALAREAKIPLLVGSPDRAGHHQYTNSALFVTETGEIRGKYDKRHLVPFGEYVPLQPLFFFLDKLVVGIGDFVPGQETTVFRAPFGRFGVLICYEAIFPEEVRLAVRDGADFLVNITNDAWFGRTSAPYQHLAMAAFRAVENNVYLVRAANAGISAIVEPSGRIVRASDLFTDAAFIGQISLRGGETFYTRYGDVFAGASLVMAAVLLAVGRRRACRG